MQNQRKNKHYRYYCKYLPTKPLQHRFEFFTQADLRNPNKLTSSLGTSVFLTTNESEDLNMTLQVFPELLHMCLMNMFSLVLTPKQPYCNVNCNYYLFD